MKRKDWSGFLAQCSSISEIMTVPQSATPLTKSEKNKFDKLILNEELSPTEIATLERLTKKQERHNDPELSKTAIKHLVKRYAWEKYNKRTACMGIGRSSLAKGNELEEQAIEMISRLDKTKYVKSQERVTNDFLVGKCDVLSLSKTKIIEVKTVWSVGTFLPQSLYTLERRYWMQMQGYLDLHKMTYGQVCIVLLNTPPHLIERERARYTERYVFGEIDREKYDEEMEKLDLSFHYDKIPEKRRVIRFDVHACPEFIEKVYRTVEKCRIWLNEFEYYHLTNKTMSTSYDDYKKKNSAEDNPETDSADPC